MSLKPEWDQFQADLAVAEDASARAAAGGGAALSFAFVEGALLHSLQTGRQEARWSSSTMPALWSTNVGSYVIRTMPQSLGKIDSVDNVVQRRT